MPSKRILALIACGLFFALPQSRAQSLAATPPMGWNSWDAYGFTIDEAQVKANAEVLAGIEQFGWKYVVVDEGWYMANPDGKNLAGRKYQMDAYGRLIPDAARYPDAGNGAGFRPLADWLHARGLKFGIHIVRGIPRDAVAANLPIAGSNFHARDAAEIDSPCPWDDGTYGVADNAAGQAYYNSILRLYASWGVDFLKVDCIAANPYRPTEIRQIAAAIRKTGRPIVLSLSPGPTALDRANQIEQWAQMWRISNDHWDAWSFPIHPGYNGFPSGIRNAFDLLAEWYPYAGPGHWPDADMLPEGWLGPHPGWGKPRWSRETADEQRTEFALWSIARSPLILGANLTRLNPLTRALITNRELLYLNQHAVSSRPVNTSTLGPDFADIRVWRAAVPVSPTHPDSHSGAHSGAADTAQYFGFFNLNDHAVTLRATWSKLGLDGSPHAAQNLWNGATGKALKNISVTLPAHGSAIFRVR